jgi:hypothetical protein
MKIYVVGSSKNKFLPLDNIREKYLIDQPHEGDNIEVLSCSKEFYIATGSNYFTDDLNIDCNDNTLDWER